MPPTQSRRIRLQGNCSDSQCAVRNSGGNVGTCAEQDPKGPESLRRSPMKTFCDQVRNGLHRWIGAHPSAIDWIALRDKQLSARKTRKLEAHLRNCESCRS